MTLQCAATIGGTQCWEDAGHYPRTKHLHITYGGKTVKWNESAYGPTDVEEGSL